MRCAFIDAHQHRWPIAVMCRTIGLSERTYHAARVRPPSARALSDEWLKVRMVEVWKDNYCCYGAERIWRALNRRDIAVARCTVERLMPEAGIRGVQRGRKPWTTIVDDTAGRPADLVERRFTAGRPNELWLADITYVSTWEGWLYVAFISDVFSRRIVGWQIADHLRTDLVLDALEMAVNLRDLSWGDLIHHSDRGCQYCSFRYSERLHEAGINASVGSRGDSYDNAMAEALNGTYKSELIKLHGPWRTRSAAEQATIDWIAWYNDTRLHGEIGHVPPAEYEANWSTINPAPQPALTH